MDPAVSIHCYLVFQWSGEQLELIPNLLSLTATKEALMPGDATGSGRISPKTLYGVFLKNKVNKIWNAKPRVLIICLRVWGRRGDVARMREKVDESETQARDTEAERRGRGRARVFWCFWNLPTSVRSRCLRGKHAVFSYDCGRSRREAGRYWAQQCTESAKLCMLKIMWQQSTVSLDIKPCSDITVTNVDTVVSCQTKNQQS